MDARELDIIIAEAEAEVEKMWMEFLAEWEGNRASQEQPIDGTTISAG